MATVIVVLEHARLCGSLDVYLLADAFIWYVVIGIEMSEGEARAAADFYADAASMPVQVTEDEVYSYPREADARREFERLREGG